MFVGHAGVALGAAGLRPRTPLFALLLATFALDLLESTLWAVGASEAVPNPAESVPVTLALAAAVGLAYAAVRRDAAGAAVVAVVAFLHFPADLVSGQVVLWPEGPTVGLNLFNAPVADWAIECTLAAGGWALWRRSLPRASRRAPLAYAVLAGLLLAQAGFLAVLRLS